MFLKLYKPFCPYIRRQIAYRAINSSTGATEKQPHRGNIDSSTGAYRQIAPPGHVDSSTGARRQTALPGHIDKQPYRGNVDSSTGALKGFVNDVESLSSLLSFYVANPELIQDIYFNIYPLYNLIFNNSNIFFNVYY